MTKHKIATLKDYDISPDGRIVVMNFADENDQSVSLELSTIELEKISHELGFAITQARRLSDISKQGIIPILNAAKWKAEVLTGQPVVIISFALRNGLEIHYGIPATDAPALAQQIVAAGEQGISAKRPSSH